VSLPAMRADFMLREVGATSGVLLVLVLTACASSPSAPPQPAESARGACGNGVLHEEFERQLAAAQAEPVPEKRADAVCQVAHDWGIEDCSNVTPRSLELP